MPAAPAAPLTIKALRARGVEVPLDPPLVTGGGSVTAAPLVLIDLEAEDGTCGHAWLFAYTPLALPALVTMVRSLEPVVVGAPLSPVALAEKLQARFRLLGTQGIVGQALSGLDMAAWDALAKVHGLPLARLLGGEPVPVPAYSSLRSVRPDDLAHEAAAAVEAGFRYVKLRLGVGDLAADLAQLAAVRQAVGESARLLADYNQSQSVPDAIRRIWAFDELDLVWIEEPTRAEDIEGHAQIAREVDTPVQTGENWWGIDDMARHVAGRSSDLVMPDAGKIGGVTGWLHAAGLARAHGLPTSSHLYVEFSSHLLAVTPTRHLVEYLDLAGPVLAEPLWLERGLVTAPERPGSGIAWDETAVERWGRG